MQRFKTFSSEQQRAAIAYLDPEHQQFFENLAGPAVPVAKRPAARAAVKIDKDIDWGTCLAKRKNNRAEPTEPSRKRYREKVLEDRARVRRRFDIAGRAAKGEEVDNDTGLPPPKRSRLAADVHCWCKNNSWAICAECSSMVMREMTEKGLTRELAPVIQKRLCSICRGVVKYAVPDPATTPAELIGLSPEAAEALSPLEVDVGPELRARQGKVQTGYRMHATMIRFRWKKKTVKDAILELEDEEQKRKARKARKFLLSLDTSMYKEFYDEHKDFLREHPEADDTCRRRRMQFIERKGLECAIWPTLFFDSKRCLTVVRAGDCRRVGREEGPTLEELLDATVPEQEDADDGDGRRHSTKRAFAALALSPHIGFGSAYNLLHFAYDLNLWSALGGKKSTSTAYSTPMRVLMKGHTFSPLYWKIVHWALLDYVRQLGYPKVFWTLSPYEWSFPYHQFVLDEMSKELRDRMHLPLAETLHITHVLLQTVKGLLVGSTGHPAKDPWKRQLCQAWDEEGIQHKVHVFLRLEFQDGTRKAPTQDYHGSGRPHIHVLIFCSKAALAGMDLDESVSATMPDELEDLDVLPGIVRGSQLDQHGESGWPVHEGFSGWNSDEDKLGR